MKSIFKKFNKSSKAYPGDTNDLRSISSSLTLYSIDSLNDSENSLQKVSSRQRFKNMISKIISINENKSSEYQNASTDSILLNLNQYEYLGYIY